MGCHQRNHERSQAKRRNAVHRRTGHIPVTGDELVRTGSNAADEYQTISNMAQTVAPKTASNGRIGQGTAAKAGCGTFHLQGTAYTPR